MRKYNILYFEIKSLEILQIKIIAFYLFNYKNIIKISIQFLFKEL